MNKLPLETRVRILSMLCEGSSMRSISRVADVSINTVSKILIDAGKACVAFHDEKVRGVKSQRIQCDEIWSFTYAKAKNVATAKKAPVEAGDTWTWTALDADSKLIVSWLVGGRDSEAALAFMDDVAKRLVNRVQLTTDGHKAYLNAVEEALGADIDYAMLVKLYGESPEGANGRYSPAECTGAVKHWIEGNPDAPLCQRVLYRASEPHHTDADARRFARVTSAFSKKIANHIHMVALYTVWYNFVKQHKSLKGLSPAMAAGVSKTLWNVEDIAALIDARQLPRKSADPIARRKIQTETLRDW